MMKEFSLFLFVFAMLFLSGCSSSSGDARLDELLSVVDKNTGYAHFTRGMNTNTVNALKKAVTMDDIPTLINMISHEDSVAAMTAANVVMEMGHDARAALYHSISTQSADTQVFIAGILFDFSIGHKKQVQTWAVEDKVELEMLLQSEELNIQHAAERFLEIGVLPKIE